MKKAKKYVYDLLTSGHKGISLAWFVEVFLIAIIVISVSSLILETVPSLQPHQQLFHFIDLFSVIIFSLEYILRVWTITENPKYSHPVRGRIKYIFSFIGICDLLSIAPFYLPIIHSDFRALRLVRFLRLLRVFKMLRYIKAFKIIGNVIDDKKEELLVSLVLMLFVLILISTLMFFVEHDAQPDKFSSIPATMWWGIATLTTVGYGDIYPVTTLGKLLAGVGTIIGIGLFAVPTAILASGFSEMLLTRKKHKACPHCGAELEHDYLKH